MYLMFFTTMFVFFQTQSVTLFQIVQDSELQQDSRLPKNSEFPQDSELAQGSELPEVSKLPHDSELREDSELHKISELTQDPESNKKINNCYDSGGNVIVCPYNSKDPQRPDGGTPCLPDEPAGDLGPGTLKAKKGHYTSTDCGPTLKCSRIYFVSQEKVSSRHEASEKCESIRMRLVSIENASKWREVLSAIRYPGNYWTSGIRNGENLNAFIWGTGCPFTFVNWGYLGIEQQPDNANGYEDCVEITKDYTWNDFPCTTGFGWWYDYKKSYICESLTCKQ